MGDEDARRAAHLAQDALVEHVRRHVAAGTRDCFSVLIAGAAFSGVHFSSFAAATRWVDTLQRLRGEAPACPISTG